ncbi:glycosyltransferase [Paraliomyxa miuraensis]|uniref:glycosyltransferase n=1 Tax=Paraliomyxa miuraensis TaxID=376150 RepID=UPI002255A2BA|nr:glycosyltransferase [Paraliomyxa miuraensis]MCX4247802.1 glycosyltransferase [Paraliomyxa miuraensis]
MTDVDDPSSPPASPLAILPAHVGVVVIGRNEGQHLLRGLGSIGAQAGAIAYADSDSADDSVALVREHFPAVAVVEMKATPGNPMSPARGRNEGYAALRQRLPAVRYVQFLDGDCELHSQWLSTAANYLDQHPEVGIVTGRLRERERNRNAFHRLADMEWDQPPGEVNAMGGIMMVRAEVWERVGGQNALLPAGEELELCWRVIDAGYKTMRLTDDMALHDIDMASFGQWWTRSVRTGHAFAQGYWVHRDGWHLRQVISMLAYGAMLPGVAVGGAPLSLGASLGLLAAYPRLWKKIEQHRRERGDDADDARLYATATVVGKIAGAMGVAKFLTKTLPRGQGGRRGQIGARRGVPPPGRGII